MTGPTSRSGRLPLALLALFTLAVVLLLRPLGAPEPLRAGAGVLLILLLPGAGLAVLLPGDARRGWLETAALSFPLSLIPLVMWSGLGAVLEPGLLALGALALFGTFLLLLGALLKRPPMRPGGFGRGGGMLPAVLLVSALVIVGRAGAPTGALTDGPDHMATVTEILETGDPFPRTGLVPPGELDRTDPRKGTLHTALAVAASLAGVSARAVWTALPSLLTVSWIPLTVLLGLGLGLSRPAAVLAGGIALLFLGGPGGAWAVRLGYGAHAAILAMWAATWLYLGLLEHGGRGRALVLGLLVAATAAVHAMAPAFFLLPALMLAATDRGRVPARRSLGVLALVLAVTLPVLVWRFLETRGPVNPIHLQVMPLLELGGGLSVLWPPEVLRILGPVGAVGALLGLVAPCWLRDRTGARYLQAATAAALGIALLPGVFDLAAGAASSLPVKFLYVVPFFWALAGFLLARRRGAALLIQLAVVILVIASVPSAWSGFAPDRAAGWRPAGIDAALEALDQLPGPAVVAADPWVSYLVAAETRHRPVTVAGQHGHPLDPDGLRRLDELGAILSPALPLRDARPLLERHRVRYVLLPTEGGGDVRTGFGAARGGRLDNLRHEKFAAWPEAYPLRAETPGWRILEVVPTGGAPGPRPPWLPGGRADFRGARVSAEDGATAGVVLAAIELPRRLTAGEENQGTLWWQGEGGSGEWPVEAHVRLTALEASGTGKLVRLLRRRLPGSDAPRQRFRGVFSPFQGAFPVSAWGFLPGTDPRIPFAGAWADPVRLQLPADLEPGSYVVSVRVLPRPVFGRIALRDILFEDDRWQGSPVDTVEISVPGPETDAG